MAGINRSAVIGDLYLQVVLLQSRVEELEAELAESNKVTELEPAEEA